MKKQRNKVSRRRRYFELTLNILTHIGPMPSTHPHAYILYIFQKSIRSKYY